MQKRNRAMQAECLGVHSRKMGAGNPVSPLNGEGGGRLHPMMHCLADGAVADHLRGASQWPSLIGA
jgi:hypothetical protein